MCSSDLEVDVRLLQRRVEDHASTSGVGLSDRRLSRPRALQEHISTDRVELIRGEEIGHRDAAQGSLVTVGERPVDRPISVEVDEGQVTVVAPAVHPAGDGDGLACCRSGLPLEIRPVGRERLAAAVDQLLESPDLS